mmetsp:Transcript_72616/g.135649  ORF Transcript_72616/g.135649 Transcript_72616/m.135649 type:complete len:617 (-) Transcript_72616:180-2030(-)
MDPPKPLREPLLLSPEQASATDVELATTSPVIPEVQPDPDLSHDVAEEKSMADSGLVEGVTEWVRKSSPLDGSGPAGSRYVGLGTIAVTFLFAAVLWTHSAPKADTMQSPLGSLKVVTWNVGAINNNPFQQWTTHDDPDYTSMMLDIEAFRESPGEADVPLSEVFKEAWVDELAELMKEMDWPEVHMAVDWFKQHYMFRGIVTGFMKALDGEIGAKRFVSMPDRLTNTLQLEGGALAYRPAACNCYRKKFVDLDDWWQQWKGFMFKQVANGSQVRGADRIPTIRRAKYVAVTPDEEKMSQALSTLCQAAFDAITIHTLSTVGGSRYKQKWQDMRLEMCEKLNDRKWDRALEILGSASYFDADVIFLQEVGLAFAASMRHTELGEKFDIASANFIRDESSVILLNKRSFNVNQTRDLTAEFEKFKPVWVQPGDLSIVSAQGTLGTFLLASYHGRTNGVQTIPVLDAVHALAQSPDFATHQLIFGLDANSYGKKQLGYLYVGEFADAYVKHGYTSCWGDLPNPKDHTTFNAKTYMQLQLHRAVRLQSLASSALVDKNPKDFILFGRNFWRASKMWKDNTGNGQYKQDMVLPTLSFPSRHSLIATELEPLTQPLWPTPP